MAKQKKSEPQPKRVVLLKGGARCIVFAQSADGKALGRDYLLGLSEVDQRKFGVQFSKLGEGHKLSNPDRLRDLGKISVRLQTDGKMHSVEKMLWEIKIDGHRLLAFQDGLDWVLTNGCPKIGKKAFRGEMETAENVITDYLGR